MKNLIAVLALFAACALPTRADSISNFLGSISYETNYESNPQINLAANPGANLPVWAFIAGDNAGIITGFDLNFQPTASFAPNGNEVLWTLTLGGQSYALYGEFVSGDMTFLVPAFNGTESGTLTVGVFNGAWTNETYVFNVVSGILPAPLAPGLPTAAIATPEPASFLLVSAGFFVVALRVRARKRVAEVKATCAAATACNRKALAPVYVLNVWRKRTGPTSVW